MLITTPEAYRMTYQFDIIIRDQKSHRLVGTDCFCVSQPILWFDDIWNTIRTHSNFGAKKKLNLNAFYLFEKGGGRIMPYEGNVGVATYRGRALKVWLREIFCKFEPYAADYAQFEVDIKTPYRWIDIYITPKKED